MIPLVIREIEEALRCFRQKHIRSYCNYDCVDRNKQSVKILPIFRTLMFLYAFNYPYTLGETIQD